MKKILLILGILSILVLSACVQQQPNVNKPIKQIPPKKECVPSEFDLQNCPSGYRQIGACLHPDRNPTDCGENLCYMGSNGYYSCCAKGIVC